MGNKWLVLIGAVLGLVAVAMTNMYISGVEDAQVARSYVKLAANVSYGKGDTINPENLEIVDLPEDFGPLSEVAVEFTPALEAWFNEKNITATQDIAAGSVLLYEHMMDTPEQRFAVMIREGYRAITIPVDTSSAVSYFVEPGSNVDVLATLSIPNPVPPSRDSLGPNGIAAAAGAAERLVTKTILQNISVLAVGQATTRGSYLGAAQSGYPTVTFEVTPEQAEILTFTLSQSDSGLNLVLRNPVDQAVTNIPEVDFSRLND